MNGHISWSPGVKLEDIERQVILKAYAHFQKNKTATAIALGIAVRTLDSKLAKYDEDNKAIEEKDYERRRARESQLDRARGIPQPAEASVLQPQRQNGVKAAPRAGMESVANAAPKQTLPMPQPEEIQGVLPAKAAQGGARKGGR